MITKIKVAVISCGMIARNAHIPAYKHFSEYYDLTAVCDVNAETARKTAQEFGVPHFYTDVEQMLIEQEPDLVSVCVPNMLHKQYTMMALKYGANVLCEKPVAFSLSDALEMYGFAADRGLRLIACQSWRFMPERIAAKRIIDSGMVGNIYYAEFSRIRRRGIPTWGKFHLKEHSGGGAFLDIGVHVLDAAVWLMGNPKVRSVIARTQRLHVCETVSLKSAGALAGGVKTGAGFNPDDMDVESFAGGIITFENDAVIEFKTAWAANLPEENNIVLLGEKSGIDIAARKVYYGNDGVSELEIPPNEFPDKSFYGHFYLIGNVARALRGEEDFWITPEETVTVSAVIEAVYRSAELGREIYINEL